MKQPIVQQPIMQRAAMFAIAIALGAAATTACRLNPLVDDTPGASATILPAGATIPDVTSNTELATQIQLNDSIDTKSLLPGNIIPRGTMGEVNGATVPFWVFGQLDRAPAPMYVFGTGDPTMGTFAQNSHLPLVTAVPGDGEYSQVHTIYQVVTTSKYQGEKITSAEALDDAIQIGLVQAPVAVKQFVDTPIVRSGTQLDVGTGGPASPVQVYAHGVTVDSYRLGGDFAVQPNPQGLLPTSQVSFLRAQGEGSYNAARPIFQATIPTAQPMPGMPNYTPLSVVINVDLAPGTAANSITKDSELFVRSPPVTGAITGTTPDVLTFSITTTTLDMQLQFQEGKP